MAEAHEEEERRAENLRQALITRQLIGQAQGILMERERITAEQAFDILRRASQHLNTKLREVAQDTGRDGRTAPHRLGRPCPARAGLPRPVLVSGPWPARAARRGRQAQSCRVSSTTGMTRLVLASYSAKPG